MKEMASEMTPLSVGRVYCETSLRPARSECRLLGNIMFCVWMESRWCETFPIVHTKAGIRGTTGDVDTLREIHNTVIIECLFRERNIVGPVNVVGGLFVIKHFRIEEVRFVTSQRALDNRGAVITGTTGTARATIGSVGYATGR